LWSCDNARTFALRGIVWLKVNAAAVIVLFNDNPAAARGVGRRIQAAFEMLWHFPR
jgi:hypothetical protein